MQFGSRKILSMCFSINGRMFAAQGGALNYKLFLQIKLIFHLKCGWNGCLPG
jgi:hypothetical protein